MELEPARGVPQRLRFEPQHVRPPGNRPADDARLLEQLQVLRHGRFRDAEPARSYADRRRAGREPADDRTPHGVREREEAAIEIRVTVHLLVNYSGLRLERLPQQAKDAAHDLALEPLPLA